MVGRLRSLCGGLFQSDGDDAHADLVEVGGHREIVRVDTTPSLMRLRFGPIVAVAATVIVAGCGTGVDGSPADEAAPTTSTSSAAATNEAARGESAIVVAGHAETAVPATIFIPEDISPSSPLGAAMMTMPSDVARVVQPGTDGYDAVVLVDGAPHCGLAPRLTVSGDPHDLSIEVTRRVDPDCDRTGLMFIGLDLAPGFEAATLTVSSA